MFSLSLSRRPLATALRVGVALSLALGAAFASPVFSARPASAHAVLVKITPNAGAQLTTAPTEVVLEFDESVSTTFVTVVVTTAAGVSVARGKPTVVGAKVTQPLSPDLTSGRYRVAFRLVSDDGHPVTGESSFTLRLTGAVPPTSAVTPSGSASASASASGTTPTPSVRAVAGPTAKNDPIPVQGGWLSSFPVLIAGAVGLVVIGVGVLLWGRQRR